MMRVASCSDDISSEKKPTMPPSMRLIAPSGCALADVGLGDVEGDVGGERGLAHGGAAGEDDEVGGLQAAHHAVEVVDAGRDAGELAVALEGFGGHVDGAAQGVGEALEAALVAARFGELVEPALGLLDLLAGGSSTGAS